MPRLTTGASLLVFITVFACSEASEDATVVAPRSPLLAKSTVTDPTATFSFPVTDTLNVQSDGAFSDGTVSVYADGVCGVASKIYATTEQSNSGDATLSTNAPRTKDRTCAAFPRRIRLIFPDGLSEMTYTGTNLQQIENTTYAIPVGATAKRALHMGTGESTRCTGMVWAADERGTPLAGDSVLVTRTAPDTWHVQSQPAPNNHAHCKPSGVAYNMAIDFTVTSSRQLP
jgi:hypothetical protein